MDAALAELLEPDGDVLELDEAPALDEPLPDPEFSLVVDVEVELDDDSDEPLLEAPPEEFLAPVRESFR
ncbi:MAG: hypothetical protein ACK5MT_07440 [Actinomycetales bacterium]